MGPEERPPAVVSHRSVVKSVEGKVECDSGLCQVLIKLLIDFAFYL